MVRTISTSVVWSRYHVYLKANTVIAKCKLSCFCVKLEVRVLIFYVYLRNHAGVPINVLNLLTYFFGGWGVEFKTNMHLCIGDFLKFGKLSLFVRVRVHALPLPPHRMRIFKDSSLG